MGVIRFKFATFVCIHKFKFQRRMKNKILIMSGIAMALSACSGGGEKTEAQENGFEYAVERFADLQLLRYQVPGFETLSLKQKQLLYHLSEAALMGRDILFDQNCRYNLAVRRTLEAIYEHYKGDRRSADFKAFEIYLKRVWFSNGIHHHYAEDKFFPEFTPEFFSGAVMSLTAEQLPLRPGQTAEQFLAEIAEVIDPLRTSEYFARSCLYI